MSYLSYILKLSKNNLLLTFINIFMKSKTWINRQKNDYFVRKAKQLGYINRAAFKLEELEKKFNLIKNSSNVFEFGSSPGGWTQVILNSNKDIKITSIDLQDLKINDKNITFMKEDFLNFDFITLNKTFDLVLSDVAPNTTGHQSTDHLRITQLIFKIIDILKILLNPNGSFICKIWKGEEEKEIINNLKELFLKVDYFKPLSSRKESSEIFIVARNFK